MNVILACLCWHCCYLEKHNIPKDLTKKYTFQSQLLLHIYSERFNSNSGVRFYQNRTEGMFHISTTYFKK